jgi:hypothetical protein
LLSLSATLRAAEPTTVDSLLRALGPLGIDVIYSSDLVPADLEAPPPRAGRSPLERAMDALAANGLKLEPVAPQKYVVVRAPVAVPPAAPGTEAPLQEISVYASRYSIEGREVAAPRELSSSDIEVVPGSHDDSLRALKSLPGLASNVSGRPYIRGSLEDDVLVRYDGITLLDPFHLKNYQSLISAIDPAAVERIEVFSGGFPVRYGTRSGGVIDITPPSRIPATRTASAPVSSPPARPASAAASAGRWSGWSPSGAARSTCWSRSRRLRPAAIQRFARASQVPHRQRRVDGGLAAARRSHRARQGRRSGNGACAVPRRIRLAGARPRVRSPLRTRATAVLTGSERHRTGELDQPGVATGNLEETSEFERMELSNVWTWERREHVTDTFGGEFAVSDAEYTYARTANYSRPWPRLSDAPPSTTSPMPATPGCSPTRCTPPSGGAGSPSTPSSACAWTVSTTTWAAITRRSARD